jgi:hypothetical protein
MNVKSAGHTDTPWTSDAVCTGAWNGNAGCGAVVEIEEADLFLREYAQSAEHNAQREETEQDALSGVERWALRPERIPTFRCPICHRETALTLAPREVRERLAKQSENVNR